MWQQVREKVDEVDLKLLLVAVIGLQLVIIAGFAVQSLDLLSQNSQEETGNELTTYQEVYVDCPAEYLEVCTQLSKVPTEEVEFQKVEDGKIYLLMEDGRTIIAELKEDNEAEIIAMKRLN